MSGAKVFINAFSAKMGGGQTYIKNLLDNLNDNIAKVYIVCPDITLLPDDERVVYIKSDFANKNIINRALWEMFYLPFFVNKIDIDVLFVPGGMDFTLSTFGVKKVTMFRNMLPFDKIALNSLPSKTIKFKNFILKHLMLRTMNSANHIIYISNYAKKSIEKSLEGTSSSVIYHGIAKNFLPNILDGSENDDYILYVSRFEPYKNHLNLIIAYNMLGDELKRKHKLLIIGEKISPVYEQCLDYIEKYDLHDNVDMLGKVSYDDLPIYYMKSKLFVFPSSCENCPNIILEALGCGAPIVASQRDPMPEFAKQAGVYFDESSPEAIKLVLENLLTDESKIKKMKNLSFEIRNDYLWEKTATLTWNCLANIGDENV
ncbi:glycosyltransferase family 4 protein [Vibrio vulnificus]|uniref:glycosyltransferase family 4 protein n=1 Tax=Vibrio vulnificus TaxID=672 RepID=UPI001028B839|nr:glycosyltransferase family 1 protein [Vibrio vulnificus]RZQ16383.1 glycosyltransferase family 1 protein [Vibrio vulnificus]